jgi:MFS transporter, ACS family, tartrate transporter
MPLAISRDEAGINAALTGASSASHTRHQIAARLLPFLFFLYIANYLDRTNLAYAALGMTRDLHFSDRVFGLGAGIFFVGYVALQIPGSLLIERWSARRCIAMIMVTWGALTVLTALVHTAGQLYLARFVLGAAEAGFFPGVIVYLSHWFIQEDRAKASSNFMAAIPLSFIIGSPLAGWILGHHWLGIQGWRLLFVLEGLPAIVLGSAAFFYLTDWPREAGWLSSEQRGWIERKLEEEKPKSTKAITVLQALRSRTILLLCAVVFLDYFVFYTFAFWLPTVLKRQSGFSDLWVGIIGGLPYVAALIGMLVNGWHSDRTRERRWHTAVPMLAGGIVLAGVVGWPNSLAAAVVALLVMGLSQGFLPTFWAIPTEVLSESAAAVGVGMINAVGSIAGFLGPYAFGYLRTQTGSYSLGLVSMTVASFIGGLLIFCIAKARQSS